VICTCRITVRTVKQIQNSWMDGHTTKRQGSLQKFGGVKLLRNVHLEVLKMDWRLRSRRILWRYVDEVDAKLCRRTYRPRGPITVAARSETWSWPLGHRDRGFHFRLRHGCLCSSFCVVFYFSRCTLWRSGTHVCILPTMQRTEKRKSQERNENDNERKEK
jgi:hypothetical protein